MVKLSCNAIIPMFSESLCTGELGVVWLVLWSVKGSLVLVPSSLHIYRVSHNDQCSKMHLRKFKHLMLVFLT